MRQWSLTLTILRGSVCESPLVVACDELGDRGNVAGNCKETVESSAKETRQEHTSEESERSVFWRGTSMREEEGRSLRR